jgi:hypothetical protein
MPMAKRIAIRYASNNGVYRDEAIAEAYFRLTCLILESYPVYEASEQKDWLVGVTIKRGLIRYFQLRGRRENQQLIDRVSANTDEEMIDWLSGLFGDDEAFRVYHLLRQGVTFDQIENTDMTIAKIARRLRLAVSSRLKRLEALKAAGLKISREIKYVDSVGDTQQEGDEAGDYPGECEGDEHIDLLASCED